MNIDLFIKSYMRTALWAETDNADDSGGEPLDQNYRLSDIAGKTYTRMRHEAEDFVFYNIDDLNLLLAQGFDEETAGACFWLNRNGHGTGFWDRNLGELGERLDKASELAGEVSLYVGDDGKIYQMGAE